MDTSDNSISAVLISSRSIFLSFVSINEIVAQ